MDLGITLAVAVVLVEQEQMFLLVELLVVLVVLVFKSLLPVLHLAQVILVH